jgi:enoyl-CoA hydratase/carnithine racemase
MTDGAGAAAPPVLYEAGHGVAVVTLNRPERLNAWTPELGDGCVEALERADADPEVRAIVLTGAGRAFCAGADLSLLGALRERPSGGALRGRREPAEMLRIRKPVIGAINGAAVGVGFVYAAMTDVRFAAAGARMGTGFARLGLVAEHATSWLLLRLIGRQAAMDLLLSGRLVPAEEALALGLVARVHPPERLLPEAVAYASDLADHCSPRAMAVIKHQVLADADRPFEVALRASAALVDEAVASADFREAMTAAAERRPPRFAPLRGEEEAP